VAVLAKIVRLASVMRWEKDVRKRIAPATQEAASSDPRTATSRHSSRSG
jgi:hypothetical protein